MTIKFTESEVLIGSDALGYTHLCFVDEYYDPYKITEAQALSAKEAGVITEEEYQELIST